MYIGGSSASAGGAATLNVGAGGNLHVGGELRIYASSIVNWNSGTIAVAGALNVPGGRLLESRERIAPASRWRDLTSAGGIVDLNDNDLQVTGGSSYAQVAAQIASARNGGSWNGSGITSTAAASNSLHNTTLGARDRNRVSRGTRCRRPVRRFARRQFRRSREIHLVRRHRPQRQGEL
jgi:hypothetical protein